MFEAYSCFPSGTIKYIRIPSCLWVVKKYLSKLEQSTPKLREPLSTFKVR